MVGRAVESSRESTERLVGRVRSAVYGTVLAMSVLAYLGDHEPAPGVTALTVAATGVVICLAEAYAELLAHALAGPSAPSAPEIRAALRQSSWAAAPGVVAAIVLLTTMLLRIDLSIRIDLTLWLGVAALAVCSVLVGRAAHRRPAVRVAWTLASLALGSAIVALKAALH